MVYQAYIATGAFTSNDTLFELLLERALHAKCAPRPSWPPGVHELVLQGSIGVSNG